MNTLVVDPCSSERQAIVAALLDLGNIKVHGAVADLGGAVRSLAEYAPDLVVTRARFHDGDGLDVIEAVRRNGRMPWIVVIGEPAAREEWPRYQGAGADRFVQLDRDLHELRDVVAAIMQTSRQTEESSPAQLLARMSVGVVHDFHNYLHVLGTTLAFLERAPTDARMWAAARTTIDQATRLTSTLLGYVRGRRPAPETVELGPLVRRTLALADSAIPMRVTRVVDIADDLPPIYGVVTELEQLVLNLVLNACDAMPTGGELVVRVVPRGTAVVLEVADSGRGLRDAGAGASSKPGQAAGIGLGIVRSVVQRHHAALEIITADRVGTSIQVVFADTHAGA